MANINIVQANTKYISGNGVVTGATSVTLTDLNDIYGNALSMADFGLTGYITFEPDTTNEESATFTGVTTNSNGTVTLTGLKTTLAKSPYTETLGLVRSHGGGTGVVVTDTAAFWNNFANKLNNETITGLWKVPDPIGSTDIANRQWVLSVATGGTISIASVVVTGTAGEAIPVGNLVYLKSDGLWYLTDADTASTVEGVQLGIAQGAGSIGVSITGGVLVTGIDGNQTGGVAGSSAYASNTAGSISTIAGTNIRVVGNYLNTTSILFNPTYFNSPTAKQKDALVGSLGTPSSTNKYITQDNTSSGGVDQSQTVYNSDITVGDANISGLRNKIAQSFIPVKTKIRGASLYKVANTGTFTGTVTVSLQADSSGNPSGIDLASITLTNTAYNSLPVGSFDAIFTTEYSMTVGSTYWFVVSTSTSDASNHPNLGADSLAGYSNGTTKYNNAIDGWVTLSGTDLYFETLEGINNQIVSTDTDGIINIPSSNNKTVLYSDITGVTFGGLGTVTTQGAVTLLASKEILISDLKNAKGLRIFVPFVCSVSLGTIQPQINVNFGATTVTSPSSFLQDSTGSGVTASGSLYADIIFNSTTSQTNIFYGWIDSQTLRSANVIYYIVSGKGSSTVDISSGITVNIYGGATYTAGNSTATLFSVNIELLK